MQLPAGFEKNKNSSEILPNKKQLLKYENNLEGTFPVMFLVFHVSPVS